MLSDATERQRASIFQWMDELNIHIDLTNAIDDNLLSYLVYRTYSNHDIDRVQRALPKHLRLYELTLPMFKLLLRKLNQNGKVTKDYIVSYLIIVATRNRGDFAHYLCDTFDFADWVKEIIDGHLKSNAALIEHGISQSNINDYSYIHLLKGATGVFNDPWKRIKR